MWPKMTEKDLLILVWGFLKFSLSVVIIHYYNKEAKFLEMTSVASKHFQCVDKNEENLQNDNFSLLLSKSKVRRTIFYFITEALKNV